MVVYNSPMPHDTARPPAASDPALEADSAANTVSGIVRTLRNEVIAGKFAPGRRLREVEVCEKLNVSRTPVREAFRVLQSEGFLKHVPRCGVVVAGAGLLESEVRDLWELRAIVEQAACALAARNASAKDIREIEKAQQRLEKFSSSEPAFFADLDTAVHFAIARACGNKHLEATITHLWQLASLARIRSLYSHDRSRASCLEHRNLVEAIAARDEVLAERFMEIHMKNSFLFIRDMLREQQQREKGANASLARADGQRKRG